MKRIDGNTRSFLLSITVLFLCVLTTIQATGQVVQRIKKTGTFTGKGTVVDLQPGEITIAREDGVTKSFIIQDKDDRAISLDGNDYIVSMPAKIEVYGTLRAELLERGMYTDFKGSINRFGKPEHPISKMKVVKGDADVLAIDVPRDPKGDQFAECNVLGRVVYYRRGKLFLEVPKSRMAAQKRITFELSEDATFDISSEDLNRVRAGDIVESFDGEKMDNGAHVIRNIKILLAAKREKATVSYSDQLFQKYSNFSDEPGEPRTERSANFILHTDLSLRSSKVLLAKLENMFGLVFRYYNKRPREKIEVYVVRDLDNFAGALPAFGVAKIAEGAGVTLSQGYSLMQGNKVKGKRTKAIVYSCEDHAVVQHEAVHAYCAMAFGSTGPTWYSEGMAEVGQYWKPDNPAVEIDAVVIEYLTSAKKKKLTDIVAAGQITGDSWKAYAWRWAVCHLLANNPNYSRRFKRLGMNMMSEEKDSFKIAFGDLADKISFEYDQFVKNFDNGYRVDLCAWDWETEAVDLGTNPVKKEVNAMAGWQATTAKLTKGNSYDVIAKGKWKISADSSEITADGQASRRGQLIGVVLKDYKISPPFELGAKKRFKAGYSGQLYVRCKDSWNHLDDNSGKIDFYIRKSTSK